MRARPSAVAQTEPPFLKRFAIGITAALLVGWVLLRITPGWFAIAVVLVAALTLWEYSRFLPGHAAILRVLFVLAGTGAAAGLCWLSAHQALALFGLSFSIIASGSLALARTTPRTAAHFSVWGAAGFFFIALPLGLLADLYARDASGQFLVRATVLGAITRDISAFLAGKFGPATQPLLPKLSPKKHLAGAVAGALGAALAVAILLLTQPSTHMPLLVPLLLALAIGVAGQVGDFVESGFKRAAGMRHSSGLLGPQGGLLDALDGVLFAAPITFLLSTFG